MSGSEHRRFGTEEEAAEAWNTRAAVTDYDFAMAVHDGKLWGKCSECKERKGYYLDAETIRNQQEHIAQLERENAEALRMLANQAATIKGQIEGLHARDELIRDMLRDFEEQMHGPTIYPQTWYIAHKILAQKLGIEV
ncbi:MAG: hypothetical protein IJ087_01395 [Eggerthellaceae bacterium]|nr:hypothetical protein [Eggerthellaceae bacterium]